MRRSSSVFVRTLLTAVLLSSVVIAETATEPTLPKPKDQWIQVRTANFTIFSNASERQTRLAGTNLEELRAVLRTLFGGMTFSSPVPTYIFVFDHPKTFTPYGLLYKGKAKELGGYFSPGHLANNVAIVANRRGTDVSSIIHHEYVHYVLSANQAELPLWMNEGLAEFYSSFELNDDMARIGYPIGNHLLWLKNNTMIPLDEFMAIDHDSPDYNEGDRRGVFYAQSWALTHMLVMGSTEGRNRATVYADLLRSGTDPDVAFEQGLGGTHKEIEKELNRYVRSRSFSYSEIPVDARASGGSTVSEMSYPEVLTRLGNLLVALGPDRAAFAKEHFDAALEIDGDFGMAVAGLGRLDEIAGRRDDALSRYERAAELAPDDFMVSFLLGKALFERHKEAGSAGKVESLTERTRTALRKAAVLRPSFAEAWALLGTTYTWDLEPDDLGIKAMAMAHHLLPKRGDIGYNLTLLYVRRDRLDEARETIDRMRAAGVDELLTNGAESMIDSHETTQARVRLRSQQNSVNEVDSNSTTDGELQSFPGSAERRAFTQKYNEAVSLINAGDTVQAIAQLEALVRESSSGKYAASAQALLDQTRSYLEFQAKAEEAQRLSNSGRIEAAIEVLEPLVEQAPDELQGNQIRDFLAKLYSYRDFQDRYNRAVDLVNAGNFDAAIQILEPLVTDAPSPQLIAMADRLLKDLQKMR